MIAIVGALSFVLLLFVVWEVGQPSADDYARCRGLDQVED